MFWRNLFNGDAALKKAIALIFLPAVITCYTAFIFIDPNFTVIIQGPEHGFLGVKMGALYIATWLVVKFTAALTLINIKNSNSRTLQISICILATIAIIYPIRMAYLVLFAIIAMLLGVFSDGSM